MFLPLGDDVEKRTMPLIGTFLVAVNLLAFAYEVRLVSGVNPDYAPEVKEFFDHYGLVPTVFAQGHFTGLFTYMFLHGGFIHLLGNMIVLWAFVHTLEDTLGQFAFLFYYLLWGVVAGLAHALMLPDSKVPMVGASGAIAGMIGAYFVAFGALTKIKTIVWIFFRPWRFDIPAGAFVGIWVISQLVGLAGESEDQTAGVAWFAHLGGFVIGAVTMMIAGNTERKLIRNRHGELEIVENDPNVIAQAQQLPPERPLPKEGEPSKPGLGECPYCGTPFRPESQIAPSLLKCPNGSCDRLSYVS